MCFARGLDVETMRRRAVVPVGKDIVLHSPHWAALQWRRYVWHRRGGADTETGLGGGVLAGLGRSAEAGKLLSGWTQQQEKTSVKGGG